MDQEPSWQRQLVIGLSALLAIGVLIGGIVAVIAVKAADYAGIGDDRGNSSPAPILPTTGDATKTATPTIPTEPTTPKTPRTPRTPTRSKPHHAITLTASPTRVGSLERINLSGRYPGHDGATLQVQRSLGAGPWADFPVDTSVSTDTYATYIQTSMLGVNRFRMLDKTTGKTSNVATVKIG